MDETTKATKKRTLTDEQRKRAAAYLRQYRRDHPDKTKAWRDAYILRRAAKLLKAQQAGDEHARD